MDHYGVRHPVLEAAPAIVEEHRDEAGAQGQDGEHEATELHAMETAAGATRMYITRLPSVRLEVAQNATKYPVPQMR